MPLRKLKIMEKVQEEVGMAQEVVTAKIGTIDILLNILLSIIKLIADIRISAGTNAQHARREGNLTKLTIKRMYQQKVFSMKMKFITRVLLVELSDLPNAELPEVDIEKIEEANPTMMMQVTMVLEASAIITKRMMSIKTRLVKEESPGKTVKQLRNGLQQKIPNKKRLRVGAMQLKISRSKTKTRRKKVSLQTRNLTGRERAEITRGLASLMRRTMSRV